MIVCYTRYFKNQKEKHQCRKKDRSSNIHAGYNGCLSFFILFDLQLCEHFLRSTAQRAFKILRKLFPLCTRGNSLIRQTCRLIVFPVTDITNVFCHLDPLYPMKCMLCRNGSVVGCCNNLAQFFRDDVSGTIDALCLCFTVFIHDHVAALIQDTQPL